MFKVVTLEIHVTHHLECEEKTDVTPMKDCQTNSTLVCHSHHLVDPHLVGRLAPAAGGTTGLLPGCLFPRADGAPGRPAVVDW